MMAAGSLSGVLGSLRRGLRGVPPGDLEAVHQKRQDTPTPPFHMTTQNQFSAFTWALKPVLKSI